ncbi:MAG: regulatory protein RecX, partial [Moraxellaceae bacterium]|nr:regulatory protein RecX [Moraxellaceae bacterium]
MSLLTLREHSRFELQQKLVAFGGDEEAIERLLDELVERNLQSDQRFAEAFVRSRITRGQGPRVIAAELRTRGLESELAAASMAAEDQQWQA